MRKGFVLLLCALIVALPLLSTVLSAAHPHGSCLLEGCTVCVVLRSVQAILRELALLLLAAVLVSAAAYIVRTRHLPEEQLPGPETLITLRVRLNP